MRIVWINWAPMWFGADIGGGVNQYCKSMTLELAGLGHSVSTVSSGFKYSFKGNLSIQQLQDYGSVQNFTIVNAPIVAPAIFNFQFPDLEIDCPSVESTFRKLLLKIKPDIVHFHNIEGLSSNCIGIAKDVGAKVFYSLHNYHLICSQVGLLYQNEKICKNFHNGFKCLQCHIIPATKIEVRKRQLQNFFCSRIPNGNQLWLKFMGVASPWKKYFRNSRSLIKKAVSLCNNQTLNSVPNPLLYSLRREKMIEAINQVDKVLAVSRFVKDFFITMGLNPDLVEVNYIGNKLADLCCLKKNLQDRKSESRYPIKFIFLGYVDDLKGLPFLMLTLNQMPTKFLQKMELHVFAKGINRYIRSHTTFANCIDSLKQTLSFLHIRDGYHFEELPGILTDKDLGIVPPIWYDNAPQVVFEMLSMNVPVLAARIGGIPDFIRHKENGLLFESGSSDDLIRQIVKIVSDPGLISKLRHNITPMKTIGEHVQELHSFYVG